ncbi:putative toxin [Rhodanobacter sp. MP1X3]|uniref:putative toxin n=1 Tax=Rhodanobacter sp. MP1X3 TaxID=2723086 RepID=UPI00160C239D|nr:putative toxin [Rhodanobacter sp. MP1X3]MBB6243674.1 RHS repeat-associated protein [Rhodanobacter sp. MP1X3]
MARDLHKIFGTPMHGDPINASSGNKFQQDTDYRDSAWLTFRRFYNSRAQVASATLGVRWRHSFDRSLDILRSSPGSSGISVIVLARPDGTREQFQQSSGAWVAEADNPDTLTEQDDASGNPTGYTVFVAAPHQSEQYSPTGLLQSITDQAGTVTTLAYSTATTPASVAPQPNLLLTVTDPNGRTLQFIYNSSALLSTVTVPDGGVLTYGYDSTTGNLTSVQYPDGKTLQYVYNESSLTSGTNLPNALTGVIDEAGIRFENTGYNSANHAISSSFATGADLTTFSYDTASSYSDSATVTTPLGLTTTVGFQNILGAPKAGSSSLPCGTQCNQPWSAQTYDANGYPLSYTDFKNVVTKTTYDANGLLDQQVDASGTTNQRTTTTTWNIPLRVPLTRTVLDNNGNTVAQMAWVYNAAGEPTAQCQMDPTIAAAASYTCAITGTPPSGVRRSTSAYCTAVDTVQCPIIGLLLTTTGPRTDLTDVTTYAYYLTDSATSKHGDLQSVTDALGHVTTYASYDGAGRVTRVIAPNGVITDLTYTARGWLYTCTVRALASGAASSGDATTTITYTPYGAIATITDPDGVVTTYGYDTAHRLTTITDALGNYIQYTLDASGNHTKEQTFTAAGVATRTLGRTFNTLGQLTKVTDGLSQTVFNASTSGNYDANGNLVQSVDALGYQRKQGYDALNRLVSTIDNYNGTDTATKNTTSSFTLDALDRLIGITDPSGLTTTYTYDGLSNGKTLQSPDTGTSTDTFDAAGNRLTHTDAKGVVSTSTYDVLNRLSSTDYTDTTLNVSYHYDEADTVTGCAASSPVGHLTRVVENAVTTTYCYDIRGNVIQKLQLLGTTLDTTSYSYTLADRLLTSVNPDSTTTTYARDADGRVTSLTVSPPMGATVTAVSAITYRPFGPINSYTLGNGQVIARTYNANDALTDLTSLALNLHFARDAMGDITAEGAAAGANPATETYSYDPLYRLTNIADGTTAVEGFTYNPTGDRLTKTGSGLGVGSYAYTSGTHQLSSIGTAARTADANGNSTASTSAGQTWGYGYNGRNRLTVVQASGVTVGTYTYNAMGQRIQKIATSPVAITQRYAYDEQSHPIGEYTSANNRDTIWLGDIPVATVDTAGSTSTVNYVTADHLGTPRAVSNGSGATIWSWSYVGNAFEELSPVSTNGYVLNLRSAGEYYDAESELNSNGYRTREQASWRFLQSDPEGLGAGMSTYAAVGNNPLGYIDSLGLDQHSSPWLLAFVPGQGAWDAAVTSWQHGSYGMSALYTADMLGEQVLYVETFGRSQPVRAGVICPSSVAKSAGQLGREGEAAVNEAYDIGDKAKISINGRTRIPDGLNPFARTLSEVKNVNSLSFTSQLRDFSDYAQSQGFRFDLYTRSSTQLSGPLQNAVDSGTINHLYIPE